MKVLLLDDDPFVLRLLERQLANLGVEVRHACERAELALAQLAEGSADVDVVFCDLQMPGMDGVEFLRNLVAIDDPPALVLVSGEDTRVLESAERLARAHHLVVLGALHKPFDMGQLRRVIERHEALARDPTLTGLPSVYSPEELGESIRRGELLNHYQPKVELRTGRVVGVEALVRWQHSRDGLVFPDRFVPIAEQSGLIDALGRAVLGNALAQLRHWRDAGLELHVAVNVSMASLVNLAFPDYVLRETAAAGVPASALVLEITESRLMGDVRAPLDILTRLRLKRVGLSIDDFGTGHSSLAQLRDLPFDELKIDRGFVHGAADHASLAAILDSSLRLARQLEMRSVGEGVEDRADWDHLAACGCDYSQGYFIGRPMPGERLVEWLHEWQARRTALAPAG